MTLTELARSNVARFGRRQPADTVELVDPTKEGAPVTDDHEVLVGGSPIDEREERLTSGADELAGQRASIARHPSFLLAVAGTLMTTGVVAIVLAWIGASRSTLIEEQVPYLISGGLLGVALSVVGGLTFFAHWMTVLIREARAHEAARSQDHAELVDAVNALLGALDREEVRDAPARSARGQRSLRREPSGR